MRKLVIRKVKPLIQDNRIRNIARIQINLCFVIQNFSLFPVYPLPLTPWTFSSREILEFRNKWYKYEGERGKLYYSGIIKECMTNVYFSTEEQTFICIWSRLK